MLSATRWVYVTDDSNRVRHLLQAEQNAWPSAYYFIQPIPRSLTLSTKGQQLRGSQDNCGDYEWQQLTTASG